jgi:hypothetical protein
MNPAAREPAAPDCLRCRAFYVTHVPHHPYGCRRFGFQSQRLPSEEVRLASGRECGAFEERPPAERRARL